MAMFTAIGTAVGATAATAFGTGLAVTAGVGAAGYSIFSAMQKPKKQEYKAQMPTAPVKPLMADAAAIAQKQAMDRKRAMARSKSVKTSPLGVKDEAQVVRKKLLGA